MESITLFNGIDVPMLGYRVVPENLSSLLDAIKFGYRLIEIGSGLCEKTAGTLIAQSGVLRHELFITSILSDKDGGYRECEKAILTTMDHLKTEYLDLVLLDGEDSFDEKWQALEDLYEEGVLRAIGVTRCNHFPSGHIVPMVSDQVQADDPETRLLVHIPADIKDEELKKIAGLRHKTTTQVMARWAVQNKAISLAAGNSPQALVENQNVFDFCLNATEMKIIDEFYRDQRKEEKK